MLAAYRVYKGRCGVYAKKLIGTSKKKYTGFFLIDYDDKDFAKVGHRYEADEKQIINSGKALHFIYNLKELI